MCSDQKYRTCDGMACPGCGGWDDTDLDEDDFEDTRSEFEQGLDDAMAEMKYRRIERMSEKGTFASDEYARGWNRAIELDEMTE